jgi:hypothetical protein
MSFPRTRHNANPSGPFGPTAPLSGAPRSRSSVRTLLPGFEARGETSAGRWLEGSTLKFGFAAGSGESFAAPDPGARRVQRWRSRDSRPMQKAGSESESIHSVHLWGVPALRHAGCAPEHPPAPACMHAPSSLALRTTVPHRDRPPSVGVALPICRLLPAPAKVQPPLGRSRQACRATRRAGLPSGWVGPGPLQPVEAPQL